MVKYQHPTPLRPRPPPPQTSRTPGHQPWPPIRTGCHPMLPTCAHICAPGGRLSPGVRPSPGAATRGGEWQWTVPTPLPSSHPCARGRAHSGAAACHYITAGRHARHARRHRLEEPHGRHTRPRIPLRERSLARLHVREPADQYGFFEAEYLLGGIHAMESSNSSDSRVSQLWPEIARASTTAERLRRIAELFDCCQEVLRSPDRQARFHVFHQVSYLLGEHVCDAEVWDWLQEMAHDADHERQVDMRISVFELVPDPPITWSHLFRLWDMWFDPRARWAVCCAYHPFPRRVHQHLRRYIAHRRRHGLSIPEFSHEEFHAVLQQHVDS